MKRHTLRHALRHAMCILAGSAALALSPAAPFAQQAGRPLQGFVRPPFHLHAQGRAAAAPAGMSPAQIRHFYGFDQLPSDFQGGKQIIAIIDAFDNPSAEADLDVFSRRFALPPCNAANRCFAKVYASADRSRPPADAGWALESSLDVQWAHAIAPDAKIVLIEAASDAFGDMMGAVALAVAAPPKGVGAKVVSMSWGGSEFLSETQYDGLFMSANGVSFVAASGDGGNAVDYPAASPYVLGVGATTIATDASGRYAGETAWPGSGGGQSVIESEPPYQTRFGIPFDTPGARGVPDVAYDGDPASGFAIYDSYGYGGQRGWFVVGGTSAGAPQWSALLAIANSVRVERGKSTLSALSAVEALLYGIASASYQTAFYDVTSGSNGTCGSLCDAMRGYDYVTGLGRPIAGSLVQALIDAP
ncbi:S53 family peptidase [Burkholderia sp. MSMB1498]|uniref:S53 family peptidase n=1 Tax=Burkholderia sp. MSMB1498 TaxID=1637842 RepID=UPI00075F4A5E|nr:S53 family peptidase [Burkholderia sp. MSMB1498]KVK74120.1 peptidase S8/S53 subtilisin kexin sedolisin [Burkholderia sp. MSMB1498]